MKLKSTTQPRFAGYFKIGKNHDDQEIYDIIQQAGFAKNAKYSTLRYPEGNLVIYNHKNNMDDAFINCFNNTKPKAIKYDYQETLFLTLEQIKHSNAIEIQKANDYNQAQEGIIKAQAAMKEKRKTVLDFIKDCFIPKL